MDFTTADLCDEHAEHLQIAEPVFSDYGGATCFSGPLSTVKCFEDNSLVRKAIETAGNGRVLVVDGGGSMRCALIGNRIAKLARGNGWAGFIVNGCIRDSVSIGGIDIGARALATHPLKSAKRGMGEANIAVRFAGVKFIPGHYAYADADGVIISETPLLGEQCTGMGSGERLGG